MRVCVDMHSSSYILFYLSVSSAFFFFSSSVFYRSSQRLRTHCVFSYDTTEDLSKDKNCVVDLYKVTLSENLFTPLSALHVVSQCFHLIGWKSDVSFQDYSQSQSEGRTKPMNSRSTSIENCDLSVSVVHHVTD